MCESGSWRNFEEMEDNLTLDELMILYERTSERQQRLIKAVAAAFGATESKDEEETLHYTSGEIVAGKDVLFGYQTKGEPTGG